MSFKDSLIEGLESEFGNCNTFELLSTLSGLQVYPENHSQTIRLEVASRLASITKNDQNSSLDLRKLQVLLNKFLPADGPIGIQEDPLEDSFTDNIVFFGGNFTVYTGVSYGEAFILQGLLQAIFKTGVGFNEEFKKIIWAASHVLLTLSHTIAVRLGHSRYMESPDRIRENIIIPEQRQMDTYRKSVTFTESEMNAILGDYNLDSSVSDPQSLL